MAGCTDLYVELNLGTLPPTRFLNVWGLQPLRRIAVRDGRLSIGALATYADLLRSPAVRRWLPMLVAAAGEVGGPQIRNRGTVGGNVAHGSPAGDTLPVFAAAEATVVLRRADGERRVAVAEFFTGARRTVRRHDELLVAIEVPPVEGRQWFRKVGARAAQTIAKVVMAGVGGPRPRVAVGSVAPTVLRLPRTEAVLADGGPIDRAQAALLGEIAPIDDLRSTADYRRQVAANLLARFWAETSTPGGRPKSRSSG
jgi:CO/xanthine dehydrogenase FAD-binding subunit